MAWAFFDFFGGLHSAAFQFFVFIILNIKIGAAVPLHFF